MDFPKRGDIFLINLDPTIGAEINKTRPGIVISNDINNEFAQTVTIIPLSSNVDKVYPFECLIYSEGNELDRLSKAKCNQIRTVDKKRLVKIIGKVSHKDVYNIEKSLKIHLGIK